MSETSTPTNTSALLTLNQEVAEAIKGSGDTIKNAVKAKFVQEEVTRRTDLLARLIVAINAFRKEGYKLKPDVQTFDGDGKLVSEGWSKAQLDKKKKFDEKMTKAEATFEKALNNNEYDKVDNVIAELKPQGNDKGENKASDVKSSE